MNTVFKKTNVFPTNLNENKIGSLIALLSSKIPDLFVTKLLKIMYLIDESSIKETGLLVTNIHYKVWKKGPVAVPVYYDFLHDDTIFKKYVDINKVEVNGNKKSILITHDPNKEIDDSEFSEYELELIDRIVSTYGSWTSSKLIRHLHKDGSAWKKVVDENNLEELFDEETSVTNFPIDFSELIKHDPYKLGVYISSQANRNF